VQAAGNDTQLFAMMDKTIYLSNDLERFTPVSVRLVDNRFFRYIKKGIRRIKYELHIPYSALFDSLRFALVCRLELRNCDILYERMGWMGFGGTLASRWLNILLIWEVNGDQISEMELLGIAPSGSQLWLPSILT